MKIRGGNPIVVTDGLVLHYDAKNPRCYPGSGTTVYDISPYGNNGTMTTAGIGTTTSKEFTFTDSGEYITFTEPLNQATGSQEWTVQAWIKMDVPQGAIQYLLRYWNNGLALEYNSTDRPLNYANHAAYDHYAYGQIDDFQSGEWTLSTWAYDIVNYATPKVTVQQNLDTPSEDTNGTPGDVPSGISGTIRLGDLFGGKIGNLMIYNRELTQAEVTQNYNAQKALYGL